MFQKGPESINYAFWDLECDRQKELGGLIKGKLHPFGGL
jgi:hypothetical protein